MTDITTEFQKAEKEISNYQLKVTATITNLHGQYAQRTQELKSVVFSHEDKASTEKEELAKMAKLERSKVVLVHTFPTNGNRKIIAPVGGSRGYLSGALRTALKSKYGGQTNKRASPVYGYTNRLANGVFIEPDWIELGDNFSNPPDQPVSYLIQRVGTTEFYDVVKESKVAFTIVVMSDFKEEILLELLALAQRLGIGPKRRGLLKIEKVEKLV